MATAPGINFSGVNSGLDTNSIVTQLMAIERQSVDRLNTQRQKLVDRQTAYRTLDTKLSSLRTAAKALSKASDLVSYKATISDDSLLSSAAGTGSVAGTYKVTILNRSTKSVLNGATDAGLGIDATKTLSDTASLGSSFVAGTFTINGAQITLDSSDTLNSLLAKINGSAAGVTASYDTVADKVTLTSATGITLGSGADTSNALSLLRLQSDGVATSVSSASSLGGLNVAAVLNDGSNGARSRTAVTDGGSGTGKFFVNGVAINYNASTDTLASVLSRITNSAAGVNASYDKTLDRVVFTNKNGGAMSVSATDAGGSGNFAAAFGLTGAATPGSNARIQIAGYNGGNPILSPDDVFTEQETGVPGLTLSLKADTGNADVTVEADADAVGDKVQTFVDAYNDLQNFIADKAKVTGTGKDAVYGPLYGQTDVRSIAQRMRSMVAMPVAGIATGTSTMDGLGVSTSGASPVLSFDRSKLTSALQSTQANVQSILADATDGVMTRVNTFLDAESNFGAGPIATKPNEIQASITRLDTSIANMNRQLDIKEQQMRARFSAMETALGQLNASGTSAILSKLNN